MIRLTKRTERVAFYTADGRSVVTEAVHAEGGVYDDGAEYAVYGDGGERLIRRRPRFECRLMDANAAATLRRWAEEGVGVSALELGRGRLAQFIDPVVPVLPASGSAATFAADGYPIRLSSSLRLHRSGLSHDLFLDAFADGDGDGIADGWTAEGGGAYAFTSYGQQVDGLGMLARERFLPLPGVRVAAFASLAFAAGGGVLRCVALDAGGDPIALSEKVIAAGQTGPHFAPITLPPATSSVRVELAEAGEGTGGIVASRVELVVARTGGTTATVQAVAGGEGVDERAYQMGGSPGVVRLDYNAYDVPDQFEILYDGAVVATTVDPVAGTGSLSFDYNPAGGGPTAVTIRVTATIGGTGWDYVLYYPTP